METVGHIFENRLRKRIGTLEHHADSAAMRSLPVPECSAVEENLAFQARARTVSCMRLRVRRKVDLPQPEGPIRAVTLLAAMSRLMS